MKKLIKILTGVEIIDIIGDENVEINSIHFDSRKANSNDLFVAIKGELSDGHNYIDACIENGVKVIVCENTPLRPNEKVVYLVVKSSSKALGYLASNYFGNPSEKLKLVGITGTNGKTTCATLLHRLFIDLGYSTGLLSTIENKINEIVTPSTHTTPDPIQLNELLVKMLKSGCTHCFMEVSSHAVVQERIAGLHFTGGVFTNISHDHLDYHKTFDEYIYAKKKFFDNLPKNTFALVNSDDKRGLIMLQNCKANKNTFSLQKVSDFKAKIISNSFDGLELNIDNFEVWFKLIGKFNAYNLLSIYSTAVLLGEDKNEILAQMSTLETAAGRFDYFVSKEKITAIVDYAHTPDALENVLNTIQAIRSGNEKLITIVGCGGNRDKDKRPKMAHIAAKISEKTILTSDNPRNEQPEEIIKDMQAGLSPIEARKSIAITDRAEAIKTACMFAEPNDIILIAGKGHETYQEIKGVKHHFDDKEIVKKHLK